MYNGPCVFGARLCPPYSIALKSYSFVDFFPQIIYISPDLWLTKDEPIEECQNEPTERCENEPNEGCENEPIEGCENEPTEEFVARTMRYPGYGPGLFDIVKNEPITPAAPP